MIGVSVSNHSVSLRQTDVFIHCYSDTERADGNLMEIKHIRIRNYESV